MCIQGDYSFLLRTVGLGPGTQGPTALAPLSQPVLCRVKACASQGLPQAQLWVHPCISGSHVPGGGRGARCPPIPETEGAAARGPRGVLSPEPPGPLGRSWGDGAPGDWSRLPLSKKKPGPAEGMVGRQMAEPFSASVRAD